MDAVISALERSLSEAHEPALRQQLTDTINRLKKRSHREGGRVPPRGDGKRRSQPSRRRKLPSRR
jgi:hypothetical protein